MKKKIFVAIALLLVVALVFVQRTIGLRNIIGMLRYDQRREGTLKVGDQAPDVLLGGLDGANEVHLLDSMRARKGKPLVLIFGSYT